MTPRSDWALVLVHVRGTPTPGELAHWSAQARDALGPDLIAALMGGRSTSTNDALALGLPFQFSVAGLGVLRRGGLASAPGHTVLEAETITRALNVADVVLPPVDALEMLAAWCECNLPEAIVWYGREADEPLAPFDLHARGVLRAAVRETHRAWEATRDPRPWLQQLNDDPIFYGGPPFDTNMRRRYRAAIAHRNPLWGADGVEHPLHWRSWAAESTWRNRPAAPP